MEPTIHHGDLVCLHRNVPELHIGDLIAIRMSNDKPSLLKRVVAMADDQVEFNEGNIRRNGVTVARRPSDHKQLSALQVQLSYYNNIVPQDNLIALGDNTELSFDSSDFGLVEISQVLGRIDRDIGKCTSIKSMSP